MKNNTLILSSNARFILDLPNPDHVDVELMYEVEEILKRPNIPKARDEFEAALKSCFEKVETDDTRVMIKYFLKNL